MVYDYPCLMYIRYKSRLGRSSLPVSYTHLLIALYFVIKWAVKNGIKEAYSAITGKKTVEDIQNEKELKELGLDSEDQ